MVEQNRPQRERGLFNRTRHRSALLIVGVGALALGLGTSTGCARDSDEATDARPAATIQARVVHLTPEALATAGLEIRPVVRGEFRLHTDLPATVQPNENQLAEITTLIRGRVVDVYVDVGRDVKTGTVLARLHSGELGLAQASYLKAHAKLHEAELAFDRARDLLEGRAISVAQYQRYEAELKTARAEAREARDRLEVLGMGEADLQRLDRDRTIHSYVPIRSPLAGRVIVRNVTKGEVVETSDKLFTIADLSEVWVVANVPEKDVRLIQRDQPVEIRLSAYPNQIFPGRITYIGDVLDPATRMMKVRISAPNPGRRLKPEMFATVRVYSPPEPNALTVP
ncbi:MAG: efflux RND transporter periplasmic adaptor subunit, partial [Candidatus Methylomirabilis sp.]